MKHSPLFTVLFVLIAYMGRAQGCTTCTSSAAGEDSVNIHIFDIDTNTYVLSAGQTFCIYKTGVFKGSLINNGGVICNSGRFSPKQLTFNSGELLNKKQVHILTDILLVGSCKITNEGNSILTIEGKLTLSGGYLQNESILNVKHEVINNSGTFINKALINCDSLSGSTGAYYQSALINTKN